MISIITAVHNQLEMNQIFLENLRKYTVHPFELIIIDNNSTDGTRDFFEKEGVVVIANKANLAAPCSAARRDAPNPFTLILRF
jgi:GT2 family glycosyltransferase